MPLLPYETSDVYLASYLLCQGASLLETERVGPRRTIFRFESDEFLHALLRVYWSNDDIVVPATRLYDSLRGLKSRIRKKPQARHPTGGTTGDVVEPAATDEVDPISPLTHAE